MEDELMCRDVDSVIVLALKIALILVTFTLKERNTLKSKL